jgi:hypothetical protein
MTTVLEGLECSAGGAEIQEKEQPQSYMSCCDTQDDENAGVDAHTITGLEPDANFASAIFRADASLRSA